MNRHARRKAAREPRRAPIPSPGLRTTAGPAVCGAAPLVDPATAAEARLGAVLAADPGNADYAAALATVQLQRGRAAEALATTDGASQLGRASGSLHFARASALQALGRDADALLALDEAVRLQPDFAEAENNRGLLLRRLGDRAGALAAFDRAIRSKPDLAAAHANRAEVLLELHSYAEALDAADRALAVDPRLGAALASRAVALWKLERPREARAACERALHLDSGCLRALTILIHVLRQQGLEQQALAAAEAAVRLAPEDAGARTVYAATLIDVGQAETACGHLQALVADRPDYPEAQTELGRALAEMGRLDEAAIAYRAAVASGTNSAPALVELAALKTFAADDADLRALEEEVAAARPMPFRVTVALRFALAKAYEDIDRLDDAFLVLRDANAAWRRTQTWDVRANSAFIDRVIDRFDAATVARGAIEDAESGRAIIIVGMPRSGTTLTEQILASHPDVHGGGEFWKIGFGVSADGILHQVGAQLSDPTVPLEETKLFAAGRDYLARASVPTSTARMVTEKTPTNFVWLGLLALMLPGARFIHCTRDPVDTCLSCYQKLFHGDLPWSYDLAELGAYYRDYRRIMDHWEAVMPGRILTVAYEDTVANVEAQARRLVAHCGLTWDDACLEFHRTRRQVRTASKAQVRQPIYRSSLGRWHRYERHLRPLLDSLGV